MSWSDSLIKLSGYQVEMLQKRLAEIVDRKAAAEMRLVMLAAEGEAEAGRVREDPESGRYYSAFIDGLRMRKAQAQDAIARIGEEEIGARDALAQAFEEQKKYEQVAENARLAEAHALARRETAALDELGLRRSATR